MRQLAAILFADMTGYTALMQEDEQLARTKRKRLKEVLETTIPQHHGKILQYYGDGSLTIFNSSIDCVLAAISIQLQLQQDPVVLVRIGIHSGDVIVEEEAIYGDGVNMASRIETLAVPGGIFVSEKVNDELRNQQNIHTCDMGYYELKSAKQPVRIFAIANEGIIVPGRDEIQGKTTPPHNRLAVLPFVNMSPDPENEYFSDGITEELLNALSRVDNLKVTSRTSAFAFKGRHEDIRDIAIQLNVDKVLEGSVRRSGNRVRIAAELINAVDGFHIWSEVYDRNLTDIFAVQDEISSIIANRLRENLTVEKKQEMLVKTATKNTAAYTYYLKGLHYWNKITPADCFTAIEYFEKALALEPAYAQAYAMAAITYSYLGSRGQMLPETAFKVVHEYADKAVTLDPSLAEGYIAKASALLFYDWQWQQGYAGLQKASAINPANTATYELLGLFYVVMGQKEKAVQVLEEAEKMDPLSSKISMALGSMYIFARRFNDTIRQADKLLEMNPQMRISMEMKAWAIGMKGDWAAALTMFEEVHRLTNHPLKGLMGVAVANGRLGNHEAVHDCISKMELRQQQDPHAVIDADLAAAWCSLGNLDKTFHYINQCIDKRIGPISYFLEYPTYDQLKADPRFAAAKQRMGLQVVE